MDRRPTWAAENHFSWIFYHGNWCNIAMLCIFPQSIYCGPSSDRVSGLALSNSTALMPGLGSATVSILRQFPHGSRNALNLIDEAC